MREEVDGDRLEANNGQAEAQWGEQKVATAKQVVTKHDADDQQCEEGGEADGHASVHGQRKCGNNYEPDLTIVGNQGLVMGMAVVGD